MLSREEKVVFIGAAILAVILMVIAFLLGGGVPR